MTRVNLIPVEQLADQHLFAEWREIKMIGPALQRSIRHQYLRVGNIGEAKTLVLQSIPEVFCLGTGHVKFFYNKGKFLQRRFELLSAELDRRWVQYDRMATLESHTNLLGREPWNGDWEPSKAEIALSMQRIMERIATKPDWYRWTRA